MANKPREGIGCVQILNEEMKSKPWSILNQKDYYFAGTSHFDVYFEWEHKMNEFFSLCDYPEFEKVFIASAQLIEQAQYWWSVEENNFGSVRYPTWNEMKNLLRKKYVSRDQYREIRRQFRTLHQGDGTIMDYHKQFMYLRIRLNPGVNNEDVMDQFVDGLNKEIKFQLQRCTYNNLEELFQQANQIEIYIKREDMATNKVSKSEKIQDGDQDLRTNPFEEGEYDDVIKPALKQNEPQKMVKTANPIQSVPSMVCLIFTWTDKFIIIYSTTLESFQPLKARDPSRAFDSTKRYQSNAACLKRNKMYQGASHKERPPPKPLFQPEDWSSQEYKGMVKPTLFGINSSINSQRIKEKEIKAMKNISFLGIVYFPSKQEISISSTKFGLAFIQDHLRHLKSISRSYYHDHLLRFCPFHQDTQSALHHATKQAFLILSIILYDFGIILSLFLLL